MALLPISDAAALLDISIDTLRRWNKKGIIRATRDVRGVRHFDTEEISRIQQKKSALSASSRKRYYRILKDDQPNGYASIDLFAGAGGTALGLSHAGFEHILLSEIDPYAVQTLRHNCPQWNVQEGDVADIDFSEYYGKVDLLEGGFPCQAFSYAGKSRGFDDTRGTLFFEFARAISQAMPKVFIGENVRGLLRHDHGRTLETMLNTLSSIQDPVTGVGYVVAYRLVRAQYHDVPQKRERLLIMGLREDVGNKIFFPRERNYIVSLWDAIGDRPQGVGQEYPARKKEIMSMVPPGGYWRDLPLEVQKEYLKGSFHLSGGKTGMARRLAWDEPSLTLTCAPAQKQTERCHPEETRPLNVREYARIQTFPDEWDFVGSINQAYKQIGNAVPVNLGYYMGKCAQAMLQGEISPELQEFAEDAKREEYAFHI